MTTILPAGIDPDVMVAAALAAGQDVPDASDTARALAARALEAADRQVMDDVADALDAAHTPSGRSGPRVSDYGGCGRQVWYRETPPDGYEPVPVESRAATLGSIIHARAAADRAARYPWRLYEYEVPIPGLDKPGKIDEYDPVLGEVTDVKTVGARRWEYIGEDGPTRDQWGQVSIYGLALEALGMPVRTLRVILINRDNGEEEPHRRPYDPADAQAALDELVDLATRLDLGIAPARAGSGPSGFPCEYCPARRHCWNIDAAAAAGRSPESYTILGPDPDEPIVAWAAEQVYLARKAATEAKKAKEAVAALLDGVPSGTYGEYEVKPGGRLMPDYKDGYDKLAGLYALPEQYRPAPEDVPEMQGPPKRRDRWTNVSKVRAAKRAGKGGSK